MKQYTVLYSTNTYLSYWIAKHYYKNMHYVWCSPYFDLTGKLEYTNPPSSSPKALYRTYADAVTSGDKHCAKINENKVGIINGISYKRKTGIITDKEQDELLEIVNRAEITHFSPLLYIIPYATVADIVKPVALHQRANILSVEYIIEELPGDYFDIVQYD